MDSETQKRIERAVREILDESNMEETTEHKVRKEASRRLQLDLSQSPYKKIVKGAVQSYVEEQVAKQEQKQEGNEQAEEEEEEEEQSGGDDGKEYDDEGNLVICRLSARRKVTIQEFRGKTLVSIREYFTKEGKELPTSKGISLTEEQWSTFRKNLPAIEKAIKKMEASSM